MTKPLFRLKTMMAAFLAVVVLSGVAAAGEGHHKAKSLKEAGDILPLEKIVEKATADKPGRVIEAELEKKRGGYVYEIELVDVKGVLWELEYDAKTGVLIKAGEDK